MAINDRQSFANNCLKNKYSKWYFSIIDSAVIRNLNKKSSNTYGEMHHIVPNSILKQKRNEGVVFLTPKEHFICHVLLTKMLVGQNKCKMMFALISMKMKTDKTKNRYINSRLYNFARSEYSTYKKEQWKDDTYRAHMSKKLSETHWDSSGDKNPMYGKLGILSPHYGKEKTKEHKDKIKNALLGSKYTKERCVNMSLNCPKNSLGKKWYHNPSTKIQKYFIKGQQPEGFVLGRK